MRTNTRATVWFGSRAAPFTIDNLSLGGARLIGTMALRLGQRIDVEFDLDAGPVKVTGEVVRVDTPDLLEDQIAIRFVDLEADVRTAIRETVARKLADQGVSDDDELTDAAAAKPGDPVAGRLGDDEPEFSLEEET
jgi:hypothetical protein